MYTNTTQYLRALASDLVHGCRRTAADGTVIYTPDGTASYDGLWLRDFSYMVEYAGFAIPDQDIVNCIRYAVRHRRADGWMPDRVTTDGLAVYAAGIAAAPVGEANLDNTPFLIFTVDSLSRRMDPEASCLCLPNGKPISSRDCSCCPSRNTVWSTTTFRTPIPPMASPIPSAKPARSIWNPCSTGVPAV